MQATDNSSKPIHFSRRRFLQGTAITAALTATGVPTASVMAGPFDHENWNEFIPADKKLDPAWVRSLFERGVPTTYLKSRNELQYIGMPVGGIGCGTLYLGGDGKLWNWDIFNQKTEGVLPRRVKWSDVGMNFQTGDDSIRPRDGATFAKPAVQADSQSIAQGFALRTRGAGSTRTRTLDVEGWSEISFTGQYPVARLEYSDAESLVSVGLDVFSPFIPLNTADSSLPATVFQFTVANRSMLPVDIDLGGWLQNAVCFHSAKPTHGTRLNQARRSRRMSVIDMSFIPTPPSRAGNRPDLVLQDFERGYGSWRTEGLISEKPDFGTMALAATAGALPVRLRPGLVSQSLLRDLFDDAPAAVSKSVQSWSPIAGIVVSAKLKPGESVQVSFIVAWHFPRTEIPVPDAVTGNFYARPFRDAHAVASYVVRNLKRLGVETRLWRDTWYDSTLPYWFLDRTFANVSTLATTTSHRFATGRFWGWEGVGCCEGTCTHVWHYAQAMARLFPELERDLRERVDFGAGFDPGSGMIRHRGEGTGPAIDGHCGRILGVLREHQMSSDDAFLKRLWPKVRAATEYLLKHDTDGDGILDGAQENTLDASWFGQIAWLSSLSLAALAASEALAREMGELEFAERCRKLRKTGRTSIETQLFNGEYFFQRPDPTRPKSLGTYEACHIDQVHGQSWAFQVGLGRILDRAKTRSALEALWKYNFAPDVGPFRRRFTAGRPYALAGDAGLVMTSNPKLIADVYGISSWQIGYFNECMSGFEHQVASHMMAEGMVLESLAITRAIHDRYHARRRNPFNEIECSDHYARAMGSYGTFVSASGFELHGPREHMGFAPRIQPEDFRAAFTTGSGWGTYAQGRNANSQSHSINVRHGQVLLKTLQVEVPEGRQTLGITARHGNLPVTVRHTQEGTRVVFEFAVALRLTPGKPLAIAFQLEA